MIAEIRVALTPDNFVVALESLGAVAAFVATLVWVAALSNRLRIGFNCKKREQIKRKDKQNNLLFSQMKS